VTAGADRHDEAAIRVVLVDDQELVRAGFRMVLGAQPDIDIVGEAAGGAAVVGLLGLLSFRKHRMDRVPDPPDESRRQ